MSIATSPIVGSCAFHSPDTSNFGGGTAGTGPSSVSQRRTTGDRNHFNHQCIYVVYIYIEIYIKGFPTKNGKFDTYCFW